MKKDYQKEYITLSNEFRKSNQSEESTSKLYDLLYEIEKTTDNDRILSDIYSLLGYHQSAYDTYKPIADLSDRKSLKKHHTLEQKAKSHENNFIVKDIRKLRKKNKQPQLLPEDFSPDPKEENTYITQKDIVVFNKIVKHNKFKITLYKDHKFEDYITQIIEYINWLGTCNQELIDFYNSKLAEHTNDTADKDWFDTLDIYTTSITLGKNEKLFADITGGDQFMSDHLLDIETDEHNISDMWYDG